LSHVYCPECGFQNPESANFCARCGGKLIVPQDEGETTMTFTPEEAGEGADDVLDELGLEGPALVVRSGGGRQGETFHPQDERTTIGRSPDCGIFLDDVTVSRKHAILVEENGRFAIEDQGSLNGTFVNRKRVDRSALSDGDEVQVGKYRFTFLQR
jgi:hypothetical protein